MKATLKPATLLSEQAAVTLKLVIVAIFMPISPLAIEMTDIISETIKVVANTTAAAVAPVVVAAPVVVPAAA